MRFRRSALAFGLFVTFVAGCSVIADFDGLVGPATGDAGADVTLDVSTRDVVTIDTGVDAGIDATPPPCNPTYTLATDGGLSTLKRYSLLASYPNDESFFGDDAMVFLPFRDTSIVDAGPDAGDAAPMQEQQEIEDTHVGLWTPSPIPTIAFDITFDAKIKCTDSSSCADGLIFAVLQLSSTSALANNQVGNLAGLPESTSGYGFDIDDFQNPPTEVNDPYAPSLQIIAFDASKALNSYPWQLKIVHSTFPGDSWHTYSLSLRGTTLTASYDGTVALSNTVTPLATAIVGFTAGTGGESDAVAIRNASGQFYACTPP